MTEYLSVLVALFIVVVVFSLVMIFNYFDYIISNKSINKNEEKLQKEISFLKREIKKLRSNGNLYSFKETKVKLDLANNLNIKKIERVAENHKYYYINDRFEVYPTLDERKQVDDDRFSVQNYFIDFDDALNMAKRLKDIFINIRNLENIKNREDLNNV